MTAGSSSDTILVVAQSARALATAVARAGYRPIAVDFFADDDTAALGPVVRVESGLSCGFRRRPLLAAIERALGGDRPMALVLGSGFEDRPRLIATLADELPYRGTAPAAIAAVKHPEKLAGACAALGIPHPDVRRIVPTGGDYLLKRRAASGGTHIRSATPGPVRPHHYAQALVAGDAVSMLVLADGRTAEVVAFSLQRVAAADGMPYRFGGVTGPIDPPAPAEAMRAAARALAGHFRIAGLVSMDCVVAGRAWWLLEINPRPGASLDALDRTDRPLISAHLEACVGRLTGPVYGDATIRATLVVYAREDIRVPREVVWPSHVLDRPTPGAHIPAGAPVVTVTADGETVEGAERLLAERAAAVRSLMGEGS